MSEKIQEIEDKEVEAKVDLSKSEESTPAPKKKRATKPKTITVKNMRNGKLVVCNDVLEPGEEKEIDAKYLKDARQSKVIQRALKIGILKKTKG